MRGEKKCVCLAKGKRENSFLKLSPVLPGPCLLSKLWSWQQGNSHVPCFAPTQSTHKTQSWEAPFMCRAITGKCRWPCSQEPTWLEANWAVASAQVSVKCEAQRPDLHN